MAMRHTYRTIILKRRPPRLRLRPNQLKDYLDPSKYLWRFVDCPDVAENCPQVAEKYRAAAADARAKNIEIQIPDMDRPTKGQASTNSNRGSMTGEECINWFKSYLRLVHLTSGVQGDLTGKPGACIVFIPITPAIAECMEDDSGMPPNTAVVIKNGTPHHDGEAFILISDAVIGLKNINQPPPAKSILGDSRYDPTWKKKFDE